MPLLYHFLKIVLLSSFAVILVNSPLIKFLNFSFGFPGYLHLSSLIACIKKKSLRLIEITLLVHIVLRILDDRLTYTIY